MSDIYIIDVETGIHNVGDEAVGKMKPSLLWQDEV